MGGGVRTTGWTKSTAGAMSHRQGCRLGLGKDNEGPVGVSSGRGDHRLPEQQSRQAGGGESGDEMKVEDECQFSCQRVLEKNALQAIGQHGCNVCNME